MSAGSVVVRSGGLGDLLLSLPLLSALPRPLTVFCAGEHLELLYRLDPEIDGVALAGSRIRSLLTEPNEELREKLYGRRIFSFWPDADGSFEVGARNWGARDFVRIDPRPEQPPHAALRGLTAAGLPAPGDFLRRSWLERVGAGDGTLWLHPGSGSQAKNLPLAEYRKLALDWLGPVRVSLGEVEREQRSSFVAAFDGTSAEWVEPDSAGELARQLEVHASVYVGGDTGPTHLAAALGIPTAVVFRVTDPEIWRPLGSAVHLFYDRCPVRDELERWLFVTAGHC